MSTSEPKSSEPNNTNSDTQRFLYKLRISDKNNNVTSRNCQIRETQRVSLNFPI